MKLSSKLEIEFSEPESGWLFVKIHFDDFNLEIGVSNIPSDPMVELCDTLIQINKGIQKPEIVIWHLEPYCYYLQLEKKEHDYIATILESDHYNSPKRVIKELKGTYETIILPLYRGLKKFHTMPLREHQWAKLNENRVDLLTQLVRSKK